MLAPASMTSLVQKSSRTGATLAVRSFFNRAAAAPQVAPDEEFPGLPRTQPAAPKVPSVTASVSSSGLKIASDNREPLVATLGVEIAAGSRNECDDTAGLSHLFSRMAFRATETRSDLRLFRDIEAIGGSVTTAAGRDFVRYNISVLPENVEQAAEILAETTLAPRFAYWDIDLQKNKVKVDAEELHSCTGSSLLEAVHAAAFYDDVTLGRALFSTDNLAKFSSEDLWKFYEQYVNSANLALVGSGLEHSQLNDIANQFFGQLPAGQAVEREAAKYVGGEVRVKKPSNVAHVALGFSAGGKKSGDYGAAQVLQALLKARIGSKKVHPFLASYDDASIVGLSGVASSAEAGAMVDSFVAEMKKIASAAPSNEELNAAKNIAAFSADNTQNSRQGRMAVLGALAFSQAPLQGQIEGVSAKSVQEVAQKALASRPSVAAVGKVSNVPRIDAIVSKLK